LNRSRRFCFHVSVAAASVSGGFFKSSQRIFSSMVKGFLHSSVSVGVVGLAGVAGLGSSRASVVAGRGWRIWSRRCTAWFPTVRCRLRIGCSSRLVPAAGAFGFSGEAEDSWG